MGYTKDTIKGISWMGGLRFTTRIVSFAKTAILARILLPVQFGTYGIAALALALLEVLTETGVNVVLIQEKEGVEKYINSAWVISIVRGTIMALFIFVSAPFVAQFFQSEDSLILLQLIAIVPFLRGFINPSIVKFQKELAFHKEFWYRFSVFAVDATAVIIFAFYTRAAVSLVFGLIIGVLFEIVLSFLIIKPRPYLTFEKEYLKKILHRGKWITASGIFNYFFHNGDNIVVGKILGTTSLGLYQMAYAFSILPITEVADVFSRVTFPIYTRISEDRARLKIAFLKTIAGVSFLTAPFGFLLFFFPREIIGIILGEKWLGAVTVLPILAIFGVVRAISGSTSALFLAVGKQEYVTIVTMVSILGLGVSIVPLVVKYGIIGAGISALIGSLAALPVFLYYVLKIFNNSKSKN